MDPLSITVGAVGLAAHALRAAIFVRNVWGELQNAPAFTRDIAEDIIVVQGSLHEIERVLSRNPHAIRSFDLNDVFDVSVQGCHDILERVGDEFDDLFGRDDWRGRFAVWWNAGEIRGLLESLETKKASLTLLVQALGLRSVQEMHELLERNQATLDLARMGLGGMVHSYPASTGMQLSAIHSEVGSVDGILGDRDSVVSDSGFNFDSVCMVSKAYRRTMERVLNENSREVEAPAGEPALPVIEEDEAEDENQGENEPRADTTAPPPPPGFVELEVHEAVCARLREAEVKIQVLEAVVEACLRLRRDDAKTSQTTNDPDSTNDVKEGTRGTPRTDAKGCAGPKPMAGNDTGARAAPNQSRSRSKLSSFPRVSRWSETSRWAEAARNRSQPPAAQQPGDPQAQGRQQKEDVAEAEAVRPPAVPSDNPLNGPLGTTAAGTRATPRATSSQTSLLIEYYEGTRSVGDPSTRKPGVRVKITPSRDKTRRKLETRETPSRRSRNPEIQKPTAAASSDNSKPKAPRHATVEDEEEECPPLDTSKATKEKVTPSDISAIPPDRFLDGSGFGVSSSTRKKGPGESTEKATRHRSKASKSAETRRQVSSWARTTQNSEDAPNGGASTREERRQQAEAEIEEIIRRAIQRGLEQKKGEKQRSPATKGVDLSPALEGEAVQATPEMGNSAAATPGAPDSREVRRQRRIERRQARMAKKMSKADDADDDSTTPPPRLPSLFEILAAGKEGTTTRATLGLSSAGREELRATEDTKRSTEKTDVDDQRNAGSVPLPPLPESASRYLQSVEDRRKAKDKARYADLLRTTQNMRANYEDMVKGLDLDGLLGDSSTDGEQTPAVAVGAGVAGLDR
ncbi:hypothetical protein B0T16DRAFT_421375 [Cercophora newfieldiana]|uniref:Fungal N-terminal domain-containing protein n=1 Tax=Cercophora newfieldiana TaxID=92897 RepID=A0AA39XQY1_9PEZI|nr:hypothetical protein B0T16DRAFT_421375 [Cercophora newfieldiana]